MVVVLQAPKIVSHFRNSLGRTVIYDDVASKQAAEKMHENDLEERS
jgi:hypothetical protein